MKSKYEFSHSVKAVLELLHDPEYLVERLTALGDLDADCEIEECDGTITVSINRLKAADADLPAFLRKMAGGEQKIRIIEEWRADGESYVASSSLKIRGAPIFFRSKITLTPTPAGGCVYAINLVPEVNLPLIGDKIKKYLEHKAEQEILIEHEYTAKVLDT